MATLKKVAIFIEIYYGFIPMLITANCLFHTINILLQTILKSLIKVTMQTMAALFMAQFQKRLKIMEKFIWVQSTHAKVFLR